MQKLKYILTIALVATFLSGYSQKKETRNVGSFSEVALHTAGEVYITQGNTPKLELRGDADLLEKIVTEVRGDELIIKHEGKSWFGWSGNGGLEVYIEMPKIEGLRVSSSGKIYGKNKFKTEDLEISVSGSGKIELETESKDMDISISGSGKIYLAGSADIMESSVSGSGSVKAENLRAKSCRVRISGSGSCEVWAEEEIDARISGSGSVYYKGNPQRVNSNTSGSGRIKKM